jgi:hypothetical protein
LRFICELMVASRDNHHTVLSYFHNSRPIFSTYDDHELLFVQLIHRLAKDAAYDGWSQRDIDTAVSLTTDKFTRFPDKPGDLDCRKTFQAALDVLASKPSTDALSQELALASILNALAHKQFSLSLREARRSGERTRYVWQISGGELRLLLPRSLSGVQRGEWLHRNAGSVDLSRTGERERVQGIVDAAFGAEPVSLDEAVGVSSAGDAPWRALDRVGEVGLATCLADEKADTVERLRPSIRRLGADTVRALVHAIFEGIGTTQYREGDIAAMFGLDAASFSRFAGSRWSADSNRVPDLWCNLAKLLSAKPHFIELCQDAGVWESVQKVVTPRPIGS